MTKEELSQKTKAYLQSIGLTIRKLNQTETENPLPFKMIGKDGANGKHILGKAALKAAYYQEHISEGQRLVLIDFLTQYKMPPMPPKIIKPKKVKIVKPKVKKRKKNLYDNVLPDYLYHNAMEGKRGLDSEYTKSVNTKMKPEQYQEFMKLLTSIGVKRSNFVRYAIEQLIISVKDKIKLANP